jgi:hypothetical protein
MGRPLSALVFKLLDMLLLLLLVVSLPLQAMQALGEKHLMEGSVTPLAVNRRILSCRSSETLTHCCCYLILCRPCKPLMRST